MRLCVCPPPVRSPLIGDRLRCATCGGWTPVGRPAAVERIGRAAEKAVELLPYLAEQYAWAQSVLWGLQRRGGGGAGRSSGVSDPTGALAIAEPHVQARAYVAIAARLLERVFGEDDRGGLLREADDALGEALYVVDPGPPVRVDHASTSAPCPRCKGKGKVDVVSSGRPDLIESHAYAAKRRARGEAVPR